MSNPLALFRKYQKLMLAIAAVGAMLAFGILPTVSSYLDSSSGRGRGDSGDVNPVVASWSGRELRVSDIQNLVGRRQHMLRFQLAAQQMANERGVQYRPGIVPGTLDEGNLIETVLHADQAAALGIVISDDAVVQHLEGQLAGGVINGNELAAVLEAATRKQLTQSQLLEGYKMELAAHRMRVLSGGGAYNGQISEVATTPSQAMDYYRRLNRRMEAEVLEIPVEDFVAQIDSEPSDDEIKKLYDQYKNQLHEPSSAEPGFREPTRISINWLKSDYPEILEREIAKLSEEELRKYYEENKESYKKLSLPSQDEVEDSLSEDTDNDTDVEGAEGDAGEEEPEAQVAEYRAFEDVREDIATTLARPKASDFVRDATTQAIDEMRKYYEDFEFFQATSEEGATPPAPPSLTEMATRLGLKSGTLPMVSFYEVGDHEIGKAFDYQLDSVQPRIVMFAEKAFRSSLAKYSPEDILSPTGQDSSFVYWKTDQRDSYVPELEEARPAIVKYWKMTQALEKAKERGGQYTARVRDSNQSLQVLFEDDETIKVTDTGEFTWMTYGATRTGVGAPRISMVPGVEYAGQQFMKDVSTLESGETVVTVNQPENKVYVVYMKAVTTSDEDLRQMFLTQSNHQGIVQIALTDEFETARGWMEGRQKDLKFEMPEREESN